VALASLALWLLVAVRLAVAPAAASSGARVLGGAASERARFVASRHAAAGSVESPPAVATGSPPLPRSLLGTVADGDLSVDDEGRFVADARALRLFDYFLSAEGEEPAARIRERVAEAAQQRLPAEEAVRALALFDRYLLYRVALADSLTHVARGDLRGALATVHELRIDRFGPDDAARLFGADERLAARILDR
jgi:lipase chaperone LimK